jgi:Flp pilus assembly protein TadB
MRLYVGVALIVSALFLVWYFLPRQGRELPRFKKALNEMLVPVTIVITISIGLLLTIQGLFG